VSASDPSVGAGGWRSRRAGIGCAAGAHRGHVELELSRELTLLSHGVNS
jgi:hypothetical protein